MRLLVALSAVALFPAFAQASGQMREDLPEVAGDFRPGLPDVNPRPIESDPDAALMATFAEFRAWSRAEGNPELLLFWNRELSDETTTRYRQRERGVSAVGASPGLVVGAYDEVSEQERTTGGAYADIHPDDAGDLETTFVSAFLRSGARIVDRDALMRKTSAGHDQADRSDQQFIESRALEQGIDYLVEILPDERGDSEAGFLFSVKVTHLPTSRITSTFRTTALPAAGPERLVAAPGGFERRRDDRNTIGRVAETLAAETMRALSGS